MVELTQFVADDQVIKKNKLRGITEMILNLNEQYKQLKNGKLTSLTLRIMDQKNNITTDGLKVTVVLHICDHKL